MRLRIAAAPGPGDRSHSQTRRCGGGPLDPGPVVPRRATTTSGAARGALSPRTTALRPGQSARQPRSDRPRSCAASPSQVTCPATRPAAKHNVSGEPRSPPCPLTPRRVATTSGAARAARSPRTTERRPGRSAPRPRSDRRRSSAASRPRARCRWIRRTTACGNVGGRPSLTPCARFTASASFVRCEISRRSNCAKVASMFAIASPLGVEVSTAQSSATSAQCCFCAVAHQRGEVDHRAREPVELRHHERGRLPCFEHPQRLLHAGPLHVLRREAGVLDHLDQMPAAPLALGDDRVPLRQRWAERADAPQSPTGLPRSDPKLEEPKGKGPLPGPSLERWN